MIPAPKQKSPAAQDRAASKTRVHRNDGASRERVARLRLTARCLSLSPIFICDDPLHAELFDGFGQRVESWVWR
jgi:hypothetical protein